jgi:hypothetical protein
MFVFYACDDEARRAMVSSPKGIVAAGKRSGEHWEQGTEGEASLGDFIRIDLNGKMTFVKKAEGALVPLPLERYDTQMGTQPAAAGKGKGSAGARGREVGTGPAADRN